MVFPCQPCGDGDKARLHGPALRRKGPGAHVGPQGDGNPVPGADSLVLTQKYDDMWSSGSGGLNRCVSLPSAGGDGVLETHTTLPSK